MQHETRDAGPLLSEFWDDPDMAELVALFVETIPEKVRALEAAFEAGDAATLRRLAHQIKGAAAGYGFPPIGEAAEALERGAKGVDDSGVGVLRGEVDRLLGLFCRAAARPG